MAGRQAGLVLTGSLVAFSVYKVLTTFLKKFRSTKIEPLVVCGPSGVGKGTLLAMVLKEFPGKFAKCCSHTTRKPRPGEEDGVHYHFTTREKFEVLIKEGAFLEYADVHGNYYGTSYVAIEEVAKSGMVCVLEVDVEGAKNISATELDPWYYFITPPSFDTLHTRLVGRKSETEESMRRRLATAKAELKFLEESLTNKHDLAFDYVLENEDLKIAYKQLRTRLLEDYGELLDPSGSLRDA